MTFRSFRMPAWRAIKDVGDGEEKTIGEKTEHTGLQDFQEEKNEVEENLPESKSHYLFDFA